MTRIRRATVAFFTRFVVPAAIGASLILAFPPYNAWYAVPLAVGAFALGARGRSLRGSALFGLLVGLAFFVPFLHWTGEEVGPAPWLILAFVQALYFVPLSIVVTLAHRLPGWPVWTAAAWVAMEALRGRAPYGGFPWGKLAFAQGDSPFLNLAQLGGAPFVTFAVALAGGLLAWAFVARPFPVRFIAVAAAAGVVFSGTLVTLPAPNGDTVRIAMIQGNVPEAGLDFNEEKRVVTENHAEATLQLAEDVASGVTEQPDFVIWPENSADVSPYHDREAYETIDEAVKAIGVPTLIGSIVPTADEQNVKNTAIVWSPETGPGETYVKRRPVPFAEYIPMRSIARRITDAVEHQPRDHLAGDSVGVLDLAGTPVGDVICYEVAYDNLVRDAVTAGGQVISVQSNNATFGHTPMSEQQLAMSRVRAVEHARTMLVSTTSGISAVVEADGNISQQTELYTRAIVETDVELSTATTLATKVGEWPEWVITALAMIVAALAVNLTKREDETAGEHVDDATSEPAGVGR